jgi:uncharacterized protein YybS (DUF2232 family)
LRAQSGTPAGAALKTPGGGDPTALIDVLVLVMPLTATALSMITSLANLWLAGRIARAAGRLRRPWPEITAMTFPNATPLVFVAAILGSFLPGLAGLIASILSAALFLAYAILGFCVIHGATRALAMRGLVLSAAWIAVLVLAWPILLIAIVGLADGFMNFRARFAPPTLPTHKPPNE